MGGGLGVGVDGSWCGTGLREFVSWVDFQFWMEWDAREARPTWWVPRSRSLRQAWGATLSRGLIFKLDLMGCGTTEVVPFQKGG